MVQGPQVMGRSASEPRVEVRGSSAPMDPPPSTPLPPRVQPVRQSAGEAGASASTGGGGAMARGGGGGQPGPRTVEEVAGTARSRFELELERARVRSAER